MTPMEVAKTVYAAFNTGDIETILPLLNPTIEWTETAGYKYGGALPQSAGDRAGRLREGAGSTFHWWVRCSGSVARVICQASS